MGIIDYGATGSNRLKNWELMVKPSDEKLVYKQNKSNFWTFHEIYSTHVSNMGWNDAMTFDVDGNQKDLVTQFGEIDMATLTTSWEDLKALPETNTAAEVLKLKNSAMYTWLLNSMDKDFKKFLTQNAGKHERQGPLAWKMITEHAVKSDKQAIWRAMCKMHTLNLDQFDYNINKFIDTVVDNKAILESCGETDNSIASNLFRILSKAPCDKFKTWMLAHQTAYDDGADFDLDHFMTSCKNKYGNYVADGLWRSSQKTKKDLEKETEIVALNSCFDNLEKLLLAQNNGKPKGQNGEKTGWKFTPLESGKTWTIEQNGKTWNWCKHHGYWTTGHKTDNCHKGLAALNQPPNESNGGNNPALTLNLAAVEDNEIYLADPNVHINDSYDQELDALVSKKTPICLPCTDNETEIGSSNTYLN